MTEEAVSTFPADVQPSDAFIALTLSPAARFGAPDPATFLQGQVTCDLSQCSPDRAARGAFCDQKGRVIADTIFVPPAHMQPGANWKLLLRAELQAPLLQLLQPYAQLSRIRLQRQTDVFCSARPGLSGAPLSCTRPDAADPDSCIISLGNERCGWTLTLSQQAPSPDEQDEQVRLCAMQCGAPLLRAPLAGMLTPHELGYADTDLVSFTKGCYLGQEVVARMHHLGNLKKHFRLLQIPSSEVQLEPGQRMRADAGKFQLIDAAQRDDGQWLACACLADRAIQSGRVDFSPEGSDIHLSATVLSI